MVPRGENGILLKEDIHLVLLVPHPLEFPGMLLPVPASLLLSLPYGEGHLHLPGSAFHREALLSM